MSTIPPNDFVCNRIGPGHKFGSRFCAACSPDNPRLAWVRKVCDYDPDENDGSSPGPPPDRVAAAAAAIGEKYGWWYDPVLSPETTIEIVETVLDAIERNDHDL